MPSLLRIRKTMIKLNIPPEIMAKKIPLYADASGNNPVPMIAVFDKMDELLTKEQRLAIMEQQGCSKGGQRDADCKAFGKKYSGKPLAEKVAANKK